MLMQLLVCRCLKNVKDIEKAAPNYMKPPLTTLTYEK